MLTIENLAEEEDQSQQSGARHQPDALLARASFIGDLFLDPCFLFTHASDRHQQPPQQIAVSLFNAYAAEKQVNGQAKGRAERQAKGQAEGQGAAEAAGPVKPTARRQTGEAILKAVSLAARHAPSSSNHSEMQVCVSLVSSICFAVSCYDCCLERMLFGIRLPCYLHSAWRYRLKRNSWHDLQADLPNSRQGRKAKAASERQKRLGSEAEPGPSGDVPPESDIPEAGSRQNSGSMLRNLDIRQNISSRAALK